MHILIIEDNKEVVFGLNKLLFDAGYHVYVAYDLKKGLDAIEEQKYDLLILDWMLPDGSGIEFLKKQRNNYLEHTSVLVLSSKAEALEKVEALDAGADDYLQKPFSNIELLARIRVLLRRESQQKQSIIEIDNLWVNLATHEVLVEQENISLSKKEFELLEFLLLNSHVVLTRYQINEHLNPDFDSLRSSNLVDAHIKNLRKKLGSAATVIETVRGVGFRVKQS